MRWSRGPIKNSRTGWIRTSNLLVPNQAFCQIELRSELTMAWSRYGWSPAVESDHGPSACRADALPLS